ncbi:MAG: HAMP domain-containing histidine kinase [Bacteroidales bacterium]|nr:HAMP domain-containing histidine kinase [Bacteroidales bacterium]
MKANLYTHKNRWKWALAILAILIISASLWYTSKLVKTIAKQETRQVKMWAAAMEQQAVMMKSTEEFFNKVSEQEQLRVDLLANAYRKVVDVSNNENIGIYLSIIQNNISIPLIITDGHDNIIISSNLPENQKGKTEFDTEMKQAYSKFEPIKIDPGYGTVQYLYYNESNIYTDLKSVLEEMNRHFVEEITLNSVGAPVIITDASQNAVLSFGNLDSLQMQDSNFVAHQLDIMRAENDPLEIDFIDTGKAFIFYRTSDLVHQTRYFPVILIIVFALFLLIAYMLFSSARRSEQNQVWAGMAKETAHQLGTPLSSLMGWIELMKLQDEPFVGTQEMEKDIERLQIVTDRFSKIGSVPVLEPTNIVYLIEDTMDYLQKRFSKKFEFEINLPKDTLIIPLIPSLFRWVLENLTKNAVDAMGDHGKITVNLIEEGNELFIDISDTGKGITKSNVKQVFTPGYTSKKRGWGLGLSLAKRIIEDYHKGKIFVKQSVVGQGTTFRIVLKNGKN